MSILVLTSDTLIATPAVGNIEYSSPIFAATPVGTQRGIVPTQQYYRLNADLAGSNVSTAQSVFNVGVTLSSSTVYEFEAQYIFTKTAGTTSHTFGLGFAGTATINNILYTSLHYVVNSGLSVPSNSTAVVITYASINQITNTASLSTSTTQATTTQTFILKGTVSINAGGTFIPQYTLSAAPGGAYSTVAGSYFRINPLSASGAATNVGTWS
jgi:hypothetical protein